MAARRSPHFFKVFLPGITTTNLAIPSAFLKNIEGDLCRTFSLTGPSGHQWNVDLVKSDGRMVFRKGWKKFVADNFIGVGDFLLFRYDGSLCFTVMIFDRSACEKEQSFFAKPDKGTTDRGPKGCHQNPVALKVNDANKATLKGKRAAHDLPNKHRKKPCNSVVDLRKPQSNPCALKTFKTEVIVDEPPIGSSGGSSDIDNKEERRQNHNPKSNLRAKRTTRRSGMTVDESPASLSGGSGGDTQNAVGGSPTTWSNGDGEQIQTIMTSKKKQSNRGQSYSAPLKSQRRPVTRMELDKAIKMSKKFTSTRPCVLLVMQDSYCYHHFDLNFPSFFAKNHLPKVRTQMTLWDPEGRSWQVTYLFYGHRARLRSGWNKFTFANNLEIGDVCIFEVLKYNEMRVHIYRVVEPITPLVRFNRRRPK